MSHSSTLYFTNSKLLKINKESVDLQFITLLTIFEVNTDIFLTFFKISAYYI